MARPCKQRIISKDLNVCCFRPVGLSEGDLERVELKMDEVQAIKLGCLDGLSNIAAATNMGVSAPTFNRILKSANKKLADAIINSKAIKICENIEKTK